MKTKTSKNTHRPSPKLYGQRSSKIIKNDFSELNDSEIEITVIYKGRSVSSNSFWKKVFIGIIAATSSSLIILYVKEFFLN